MATTFSSLDISPSLIRALSTLHPNPTLVQSTTVPIALAGKDIMLKARTGSGKTLAYVVPIVQKIILGLETNKTLDAQALILLPTKELLLQVQAVIKQSCIYNPLIKCVLSDDKELGQIIVGTPAGIRKSIKAGSIDLSSIHSLVIDEADLILSYGYDEDVTAILKALPQIYQSYLISATLSGDVEKLRKIVLRSPVVLELEEEGEEMLTQYYIRCSDEEKYLLTLFMLKLRVHPFGSQKSIIFVNSIQKCYKLKLFLGLLLINPEQFGIKSCTLNSELPVKSRFHIVQEFNRGIYDYIIATDEAGEILEAVEEDLKLDEEAIPVEVSTEVVDTVSDAALVEEKKDKKKAKEGEYGVSRGIDFKNVTSVINFDMPRSSRSYQHRVGRTARGVGNKGYALTFVCPSSTPIIHTRKKRSQTKVASDEDVLVRIEKRQKGLGRELLAFQFDMKPVENFRYRCTDALRAVTDAAVREARVKELKMHFEDHPTDLAALRHDKMIHPAKVQPHMRHVPEYLMPKGKVSVTLGSKNGYVPFHMEKKRRGKKGTSGAKAGAKRKSDPLKSFKVSS